MKYFLPAIVAMMCGCASQSFDAHQCALTQDSVIAGQLPAKAVHKFDKMIEVQRRIVTTNLVIRQDVITADTPRAFQEAYGMYNGFWWQEGYSYLLYTEAAFAWAGKWHLPNVAMYTMLSGPDSTVPIPETRATDKIAPSTASFYRDSSFAVWRTDSTFILIALSQNLAARKNQHVHPIAFAYWYKGRWVNRPEIYTGYKPENDLDDDCKHNTTPCGPFGFGWRLRPASVTALRVDTDVVVIRYEGLKSVVRTYFVRGGHLTWGEE